MGFDGVAGCVCAIKANTGEIAHINMVMMLVFMILIYRKMDTRDIQFTQFNSWKSYHYTLCHFEIKL